MELYVLCTVHWSSNQGVATLPQIGGCGTGYSAVICDHTRGELFYLSSKPWYTLIFSEWPAEERSWSALFVLSLHDNKGGRLFCLRLVVRWTWPRRTSFFILPSKFCDISLFLQAIFGETFRHFARNYSLQLCIYSFAVLELLGTWR